ncbi:PspA/IM30 family protein [Aestuariimicrobium soli]|uniref:PspA/IM30 family protein n=1 Tax=Aestuariimicrobium soli TaxID=2035834 RepID=UPI003EC06741
MSGIFSRISTIFRAKADKALDKMEDPRETLDYSYQRQLELLQKVRRGVADVATSRKRVELQANQLNGEVEKLTLSASRALEAGREDLAREALTRKSGLQGQLADLQQQHAALQGEEEKLVRASTRLQAKVDAFRTRKETIKATYSAAEAQTRISEAFTGINEEMGDVGMAIQRAEDKTLQLQARASAVDELLASGALEDPSGTYKDDITRELDALASTSQVENELAAMKAQLSVGSGPAQPTGQLTAGDPAQQAPQGQAHQGQAFQGQAFQQGQTYQQPAPQQAPQQPAPQEPVAEEQA